MKTASLVAEGDPGEGEIAPLVMRYSRLEEGAALGGGWYLLRLNPDADADDEEDAVVV